MQIYAFCFNFWKTEGVFLILYDFLTKKAIKTQDSIILFEYGKIPTRKVFDSLDFSEYNVIDCDSYGIAFDLYKKLLTRKDVKKGTIIIYTAITNEFTKIQNVLKEEFNFKNFYNKAPSLFNARAIEFFYEFLAKYGIEEVYYYSIRDNFLKHYGYFIKN